METLKKVFKIQLKSDIDGFTWNVNFIDLYSFHVNPESGISLFLIIASCSSCKII